MAATQVFTTPIIGPYTTTPVTATGLDVAFTAADPTNGNYFNVDTPNGDVLIVWNTDSSSHHFTLSSVVDSPFDRTGDITSYVVGAGIISMYNLECGVSGTADTAVVGWSNNFGQILFSADSALIKFAIIER